MIVLDNIIFSLQHSGGISRQWQLLCSALLNHYTDISELRFIEYQNANNNIFRRSFTIPENLIQTKRYRHFPPERLLNVSTGIKNHRFIFHSSYYRTCNVPNAYNIVTIHDFIYRYTLPRLHPRRILLEKQKLKAAMHADVIICVSENTKNDLLKFIPDVKVKDIQVIPNVLDNSFYPITDTFSFNNEILFTGGRQGYKNFRFAVECASASQMNLIICGSPLTNKEKDLLSKFNVKYTEEIYPDSHRINEIMNRVAFLLYPSLYEGFGLPIVEAQAAGCPVIALRQSSIPEISGSIASLINPTIESFIKTACRLKEEHRFRKEIIEEGFVNSARYRPERIFSKYINLYKN